MWGHCLDTLVRGDRNLNFLLTKKWSVGADPRGHQLSSRFPLWVPTHIGYFRAKEAFAEKSFCAREEENIEEKV